MAQTCTVCKHPDVKEIEKLIVAGKPHTVIASKFDLNNQAVRYHSLNHLPRRLVLAEKRKGQAHNESILDHLNDIVSDTRDILDGALKKKKPHLALKAIKEARANMELLSKIAVKQAEFRQGDDEQEQVEYEQKRLKGLKTLTLDELRAYQWLMAKIEVADENSIADPVSARIIEYINSGQSGKPTLDTDITAESINKNKKLRRNTDSPKQSDKEGSGKKRSIKFRRSRPAQHKTPKNDLQSSQPDDSDDFDLDLDDLDDLSDLSFDDNVPEEVEESRTRQIKNFYRPDW